MATMSTAASINFNSVGNRVSLPSRTTIRLLHLKRLCCTPVQQLQQLGSGSCCRYFEWVDEPMDDRDKEIIIEQRLLNKSLEAT